MSMFTKLKQYKDLRTQAKDIQNVLAEEIVYADKVGGKVQVVMDGNQHVNGFTIDQEMLKPERKVELEKAVQEVVNDAVKKSQMAMAKKAREMGHLNLPGLS